MPKQALLIIARRQLLSSGGQSGQPKYTGDPKKATGPEFHSSGPAAWIVSLYYCGGAAGAGAPGTAGAGVASGAGAAGVFFLSVSRVLSPVVALSFFFFFFVVSPARPSGADWVCRSATSAESAAAGASLSVFDPGAAFGCFAVFARALKRVFSVGFSLVSSGFAGVSALAV